MRARRALSILGLTTILGALAVTAVSCAAEFTPQYRIRSLRVLGVEVGPEAYGKPGETRDLSMLMYDGSEHSVMPDLAHPGQTTRRPVQILWLGGCHDPDGDTYVSCLPVLAAKIGKLTRLSSGGVPTEEDLETLSETQLGYVGDAPEGAPPAFPPGRSALSFSVDIPDDIISRRPPPASGNVAYGLSYAFFLVCAGTLGNASPSTATNGLPIGCFDPVTKKQLDADSFVVGYTPIYSYAKVVDANPIMGLGTLNDVPAITARCVTDKDCTTGTVCGEINVCIPVFDHCTSEKLADCPKITFTPDISQKSQEIDETAATDPSGKALQEIIWVNYYTTDGALTEEVRLVNDAQKGWNADYGTKWQAPNAPAGEVRIWAVAHDNRGGTAWISQDFMVK